MEILNDTKLQILHILDSKPAQIRELANNIKKTNRTTQKNLQYLINCNFVKTSHFYPQNHPLYLISEAGKYYLQQLQAFDLKK